jgi:hypothetical protein
MFNDEAFSKMKKGARIVNVARGGVIDEAALARALETGQVAQVPVEHSSLVRFIPSPERTLAPGVCA